MKITEKRTMPVQEYEHVISVQCDLCKREYTDRNWGEKSPCRTLETRVFFFEGVHDRDGGGRKERTWFDICPECFRDKLLPWLKSQGAEPTVERIEH